MDFVAKFKLLREHSYVADVYGDHLKVFLECKAVSNGGRATKQDAQIAQQIVVYCQRSGLPATTNGNVCVIPLPSSDYIDRIDGIVKIVSEAVVSAANEAKTHRRGNSLQQRLNIPVVF